MRAYVIPQVGVQVLEFCLKQFLQKLSKMDQKHKIYNYEWEIVIFPGGGYVWVCVGYVWVMCGTCVTYVWAMCGTCVDYVCTCVGYVWDMCHLCVGDVWNMCHLCVDDV